MCLSEIQRACRTAFVALVVAGGLLCVGGQTFGVGICIGYTNAMAVTNYSQPLMNQVGQLRWFFAHASVGDCMKLGLGNLHQASSNFYRLQTTAVTGTPAATNLTGGVYEYMRGNPGWQAKFDSFGTYVSNGWHYPLINVAMDKLCFIDPTASLSYYLNSMTNLEAVYPQTIFVYATMPLTSTKSSWDNYQPDNNYLRNIYNDSLRAWAATNNRVLFDIADIEAHDSNGIACSFVYSNRVCQQQCNAYTSDGGHPDSLFARQLLASGFYALAAALTAQPPNLAGQFATNRFTLNLTGVPGFRYALDASTNLVAWTPIVTNISPFSFALTNPPLLGCFYRTRGVAGSP